MKECNTIPNSSCRVKNKAKCTIYYGPNLPCIETFTYNNLQDILININKAICNFSPVDINGENLGAGHGVFAQMSGNTLQFKSLVAGAGINISHIGTEITITNSDSTPNWNLLGNDLTNPAINFLGTIDNQPLVIRTNNTEIARFDTNGYLGINVDPTSKLHIKTDNIITTQSDANGLLLQNTTAASVGTPVQMSPPIVWQGRVWETGFGGSNRSQSWRSDILPYQGGDFSRDAYWRLSHSENGGAYVNHLRLTSSGNLDLFDLIGTKYGSVNTVPIGYEPSSLLLYYGSLPLNYGAMGGFNNTSVGNGTMQALLDGIGNTSLGTFALANLIDGNYNTAIGTYALRLLTNADLNTAVGYQALYNNALGEQNAAFGVSALLLNTDGIKNSAFGAGAGENNTIGQENVFLGQDSGLNNTMGIYNVYAGVNAKGGAGGIANIILGYYAGASLSASVLGDTENNVFIGKFSGFNASQKTNAKNSIALGANTFTTADNQMVLGDALITETFIRGAKTTAPDYFYGELTNGSLTKRTPAEVLSDIGGTGAQTWQQTLTTGSTLTGGNTITTASSALNIVGFTNLSTQDNLVGQRNSTGQLGYITLGSGLSLSSGVLNTSATSPYGIDDVLAVGQSLTTNRTIGLSSSVLTFSIGTLTARVVIGPLSTANATLSLHQSAGGFTTTNYALRSENASTADTTSGAFTSYGIFARNSVTRSSGANDLTNIAVYADASGGQNNFAIIVPSGGGRVGIGTSSPTDQLHVATGAAILNQLTTHTTATSANLYTGSDGTANGVSTTAPYLFGGASSVTFRIGINGATATNIPINNSYATLVVASSIIGGESSGTHGFIGSAVFIPPTIAGGVASVTNTSTVYITDAPSATVTGTNSALWVGAGVTRFGTVGVSLGSFTLEGNTSGVVTVKPAAAAGTYTLTLPTALVAGGALTDVAGNGILSFVIPSGGIGGSTGATDNSVLRADGTGGATLQNSAVSIGDAGDITGVNSIDIASGTAGVKFGATTRLYDNGSLMRVSPSAATMQMFTSGANFNLQIYNSGGDSYFNFAPLSGTGSIFETVGSATNIKMQNTSSHTLMIGNGTAVAKTNILSTTEQLRLMYDASNYAAHTISSAGVYTIAPTGASITTTKPVVLKNYTVATLPAGVQGMICYVTDALAPAYGVALVGGGAVVTIAFYDGAAWTAH